DLKSGQCIRAIGPVHRYPRDVRVSRDGRRAIVGELHDVHCQSPGCNRVSVWDLSRGRLLNVVQGYTNYDWVACISQDGSHAVVGHPDDSLRVFDLNNGQEVKTLRGHRKKVTGVAITPDGRRAVSVSLDSTLRIWDLKSGSCEHILGRGEAWLSA